jgi:hypothetical protein
LSYTWPPPEPTLGGANLSNSIEFLAGKDDDAGLR